MLTPQRDILKFSAFSDELHGVAWTKLIGAGDVVAVSLRGDTPAVLIAELADGGRAITRLGYFA